jgi:2-oxoglutarate-dependent dioxygenase
MNIVPDLKLHPNEIKFYDDYGYLVIPRLVRDEALPGLRAEVTEIMQACLGLDEAALSHAAGSADRLRQCSQYKKCSMLDELINGAPTRAIAGQLIKGEAIPYMPFTAVKAGGGGGTFDLHQDNNYTKHEPAIGSINIWLALVDMTPENGCLLVAPRSHVHGNISSVNVGIGDHHQKLDFDPAQCLPVRVRAGDAIAFTRLTVHGSGPNHTAQPRLAYALQFHRHDVQWIDPKTGELRLLKTDPRWDIRPVEKLTRM